MPYHYSPKNENKMPSKMKQNIVNKSGLHHMSKKKMMKHANHHSAKHLRMMIDLIKNKKMSFKDSHIEASKKVGK